MSDTIRPERQYTVTYLDDQTEASETFCVSAGTEAAQDAAAWIEAEERASAWPHDGDWGDEGASVEVGYYITDETSTWEDAPRSVTVTIEPDHDALIRAAGGSTDCAHDWTSEGEGGCTQNPGVWSLGGTTISTREHCRTCGLVRTETSHGSQRNPGECDTTEYEQPDHWCAEHQSDAQDCADCARDEEAA
jgi:hypothetical protein